MEGEGPPRSHAIAEDEFPQKMPMALSLILTAVTEQRHLPAPRELFHQAEREFLAVVLDSPTALVDGAIQEELFSILPRELGP